MKSRGSHKTKIHLVTFFTEGPSFDNGLDLRVQASEFYTRAKPYFDSITMACPRELISENDSWAAIFEDRRAWVEMELAKQSINLTWNQNWAALNFLIWKPKFLEHILISKNFINSGDIIFYHDINIERYPEYLYRIEGWSDYIKNKMNHRSVLLFNDNNMKIYQDTKYELLLRYLGDENNWKCLHHIWAGALAIRNDDYGRQFLEEWVEMCLKVENVSPITNFSKYPGYVWHSQEQACLSVLYYLRKNKNKNKIKCIFLWGSRRIPIAPLSIIKWPLIRIRDYTLKFTRSMISAQQ